MARERVRFPAAGDDAPKLEGQLWLPDDGTQTPAVAVAHPHPQRGGSMDSNVVYAICQGLQAAGIGWLRFNFRGVGGSEGRYGEGVAERDDVLGALAFLKSQPAVDAARIGLAGYSFGARVSLSVVGQLPDLSALFCVAPPLSEAIPAENQPRCPFQLWVGDRDGNLVQGAERYASFLPDPSALHVVAGTDHFWRGYEQVLVEAAGSFFSGSVG